MTKDATQRVVRKFEPRDYSAIYGIAKNSPEAALFDFETYTKVTGPDHTWVVEADRVVTGFLIARLAADEAEILSFAVAPERRREGQGYVLLSAACREFERQQISSVFLEVRAANSAAIAFYEKYGFIRIGMRKGYYRNPDDDAVSMQRKLTP